MSYKTSGPCDSYEQLLGRWGRHRYPAAGVVRLAASGKGAAE